MSEKGPAGFVRMVRGDSHCRQTVRGVVRIRTGGGGGGGIGDVGKGDGGESCVGTEKRSRAFAARRAEEEGSWLGSRRGDATSLARVSKDEPKVRPLANA